MGVQMNRNADVFFQRLDQFVGCQRLQQTGHILDGQDVGAHFFQLFGHVDVVFQGILVPLGISDVAGVADCCLADLAGFADCLHGHLHAGGPVQGVKDPEDIHAGVGGLFNKLLYHVVRVVGVADSVGTAQQHLEQDVGHRFGQFVQTLPGAFLQEAHGDVKGGAPPAFQ